METIEFLFGNTGKVTLFQMVMRSFLVFIMAIILLRISGRRSFGMNMPVDNVVPILLGAILARGVVGASPFWSTVAASLTLVLLHRLFGMLAVYNNFFDYLLKGKAKVIMDEGKLDRGNMTRCMLSNSDLNESIREITGSESSRDIKKVYVERNGRLSVIKYHPDAERAGL